MREFDFDKIVPCHFDAPVRATPAEWSRAFDFLRPPERRTPRTVAQRLSRLLGGGSGLDSQVFIIIIIPVLSLVRLVIGSGSSTSIIFCDRPSAARRGQLHSDSLGC